MEYRKVYERWIQSVRDPELQEELRRMDAAAVEDAFYRDLAFGSGGLRGVIGAGTNRMNVHVVARASQGLSNYLKKHSRFPSVVIGYDSRIKSDVFARTAAGVFAANDIVVYIWPRLLPVPTVSFAIRTLGTSAGVMITASHNPSQYNGYKAYGADGCQITTAAASILTEINALDIFDGVRSIDFEEALKAGRIRMVDESVLTRYIEAVKGQSVLFGDAIDRDVAIVYTPLNGTGLEPVTRVLLESGFTNITVVKEQRDPDGRFPTCPIPNPELREAMALGVAYCRRTGADLLLATDPDCDRCGIAVKTQTGDYQLLSGNEVGLLLLDYICNQRMAHGKMPEHPVFVKSIVTMDMAGKIAAHYGVRTVNVLTGFKYYGEIIGRLEAEGRTEDFVCGFEESYGYLTGAYVRDKDGVNAAFMICEMFAFYKTRGVSLLEKLESLYAAYGYCMNSQHSYEFHGSTGMERMAAVMKDLHKGMDCIGGESVVKIEDYSVGLNGLPRSDVLKYYMDCGSVVIRPSGTEPKLKTYISVTAPNRASAEATEKRIASDLEDRLELEKREFVGTA